MAKKHTPLRCVFGFHNWGNYTEAKYGDFRSEMLAIPIEYATRTCSCCGKKQYEDVHCLGLNPPEYYKQWRNL